MNRATLDQNPTLQQQPTPFACFAACVAMAIGQPVADIIAKFKSVGIDLEKRGVFDRECSWMLTELGLGYHSIPFFDGLCLGPGTYIQDTASLNKTATTHAVLLHIDSEYRHRTLDPNSGREGVKSWGEDEEAPGISYLRLDDFAEIRRAAEPEDCPHAAPLRYCPRCVADPCPIGLGKKPEG